MAAKVNVEQMAQLAAYELIKNPEYGRDWLLELLPEGLRPQGYNGVASDEAHEVVDQVRERLDALMDEVAAEFAAKHSLEV